MKRCIKLDDGSVEGAFTYVFPNGDIRRGTYIKGVPQGQFIDGIEQGEYIYKYADGTVDYGYFEDGIKHPYR